MFFIVGRRIRFYVNNWFEIRDAFVYSLNFPYIHFFFLCFSFSVDGNKSSHRADGTTTCEHISVLAIFMLDPIWKRLWKKETQVHTHTLTHTQCCCTNAVSACNGHFKCYFVLVFNFTEEKKRIKWKRKREHSSKLLCYFAWFSREKTKLVENLCA